LRRAFTIGAAPVDLSAVVNFFGGCPDSLKARWAWAVRCPFCKEDRDKVIDSRSSDGGRVIRRRRQCLACKKRFTTYEKTGESFKMYVIKKDNSRVPYDREKVITGLQKACYKRPVSVEQIRQIADKVEEDIFRNFDKEVTSAFIGESVIRHLRDVDNVAYIRFASVYRDFKDAGELIEEVSQVIAQSDYGGQPKLFE
jgi:transcriptional repressor NrdR